MSKMYFNQAVTLSVKMTSIIVVVVHSSMSKMTMASSQREERWMWVRG